MAITSDQTGSAVAACSAPLPKKVMLPPISLHPVDFMRAQHVAAVAGMALPDFVALAVHRACVEFWTRQ